MQNVVLAEKLKQNTQSYQIWLFLNTKKIWSPWEKQFTFQLLFRHSGYVFKCFRRHVAQLPLPEFHHFRALEIALVQVGHATLVVRWGGGDVAASNLADFDIPPENYPICVVVKGCVIFFKRMRHL